MTAARRPPIDADAQLLEQEARHADELARLHAALAAAQERVYWLDRWGVDLNAVMRRRGAPELRLAMRALRLLTRGAHQARRRVARLPDEAARLRARLARERAGASETG